MDAKIKIRQQVLTALRAISTEQRMVWEQQLGEQLLTICQSFAACRVGMYVGRMPEFQTISLIQQLQRMGVAVYLPRVQPHYHLTFHLFESVSALELGHYGILEPAQISPKIEVTQLDLLVVPGVAFNEKGERIGFGGGYYDRLLEQINIPTYSLVFPVQLLPQSSWQNEPHDVKIHKLLLPK